MDELDFREKDIERIAKSWTLAMGCSKERLENVYKLRGNQLDDAIREGRLVLETVCLFVHTSVKMGQFRLPVEFWRILHAEYGILVYPSALTEHIDIHGINTDKTFTDCYRDHIIMLGRCCPEHPPPCPFEYLREPPPVYERVMSDADCEECHKDCPDCSDGSE